MTSRTTALGVMSGTSLDGLDLACCIFEEHHGSWNYEIQAAITYPYADDWRKWLHGAYHASGAELIKLHMEYGKFIGECINEFISENNLNPELICSHGHTIFHRPDLGYTFQLGDGSAIATVTGINTVCDFRSADVASGGQGAPLVPVGDQLLFGGHRFCLNIGGIANISYDENEERVAFDICPVNMALNYFAGKKGLLFDRNGELSLSGEVLPQLLEELESLTFYKQQAPRSLSREWFEKEFLAVADKAGYATEDVLRTLVEHIGIRISAAVPEAPGTTMLLTGGGTHNVFLVEIINEYISRKGIHVVIPDDMIINYKEAIIFGFLGVLRMEEQPNCLSTVTGADHDVCGGAFYLGSGSVPTSNTDAD